MAKIPLNKVRKDTRILGIERYNNFTSGSKRYKNLRNRKIHRKDTRILGIEERYIEKIQEF